MHGISNLAGSISYFFGEHLSSFWNVLTHTKLDACISLSAVQQRSYNNKAKFELHNACMHLAVPIASPCDCNAGIILWATSFEYVRRKHFEVCICIPALAEPVPATA